MSATNGDSSKGPWEIKGRTPLPSVSLTAAAACSAAAWTAGSNARGSWGEGGDILPVPSSEEG